MELKYYLKTGSLYAELPEPAVVDAQGGPLSVDVASDAREKIVTRPKTPRFEHESDGTRRRFCGPIEYDYFGRPYVRVCVPVGSPQKPEDAPGAAGSRVYEVRREYVTRYEEAVLQPEDEVFGER